MFIKQAGAWELTEESTWHIRACSLVSGKVIGKPSYVAIWMMLNIQFMGSSSSSVEA